MPSEAPAWHEEAVTALTHCSPPSIGVTPEELLAANRFSMNFFAEALSGNYLGPNRGNDTSALETIPYGISVCPEFLSGPYQYQAGYVSEPDVCAMAPNAAPQQGRCSCC